MWIVGAAFGVFVAGGFAATVGVSSERCSTRAEIAERWRNAPADVNGITGTDRQRIADEIVRCGTLMGTSKATVEQLLGEPDNYVAHDPVNRRRGHTNTSYILGLQRSFIQIDNEHLLVQVDRRQRVDLVEIVSD